MRTGSWSPVIGAPAAVWERKKLLAAHLVGNAALLALVYGWLSMPDRTIFHVIVSAGLALGILCGALWLHAAALAAFHPVARSPLRRLHIFLPWAALLAALLGVTALLAGEFSRLYWLAGLPLIFAFLPLASQAAGGGFSRGDALRVLREWRYWAAGAVLLAVGAYLPYKLVWWVPQVGGLTAQATSLAVRFLLAYALAVLSWLALAAVIGRRAALAPANS